LTIKGSLNRFRCGLNFLLNFNSQFEKKLSLLKFDDDVSHRNYNYDPRVHSTLNYKHNVGAATKQRLCKTIFALQQFLFFLQSQRPTFHRQIMGGGAV